MSRYEFKMPDIGEGVTEGEIVEWHVKAGDVVREDAPLVEVMTDKATVTIASPKTGKVLETIGAKGEVVKVHATLVVYDLAAGATAAEPVVSVPPSATVAKLPEKNGRSESGPAATAVGDIKEVLPGMGAFVPTASPTAAKVSRATSTNVVSLDQFRGGEEYTAPSGKALATPATRKLARDLGVDLARVRPSGPSGRVTKDDVRDHVAGRQTSVAAAPYRTRSSALAARCPSADCDSVARGSER